MKNIYELVNQYISSGESIVLACIIDHAGSTPREIGSKMIVHNDGSIEGSVGGGILEAMVQRIAAETFKNKQSSINKFSLDKEEVASIGMTCGGDVAIYLKYIDAADTATRGAFESVTKLWSENKKVWMITAIQPNGSFKLVPYAEGNKAPGELNKDFETVKEHFDHKSHFIDAGDKKYMIDPLVCSKAFIFGGGHIGYEMAMLLQRLDFYIAVIDDREEFASPERFPQADMCLAAPYYDAFPKLNIDKDSYLVIVTRGHIHDQTVLELH
jgi:xanthine dehydrogenase accessory factor